ncbi:flagellar biosynthesis repressor FlbT [Varunaivibrio sulfuroxidans]|uniref:Flagellar protein FlbT n=1 Tax=Varunaivibrio sulfuroxidans TaxID=1773489 RepID=A0A4R3JE95_9PROT|nr:flagellar biosynthesis repressor FlbT [Varunaivibrio sulfuroxidans]TCS63000.1 flagellar protein FlbT [Varunaivibrio sulfuroxidans]WES31922.1 flagellar biosynthesis repressor FlbT [Varunaivibrio sulfuroxidans]
MPLLIDFKEGDRLIINGAVIENNGAHTRILVHNQAAILRGKEVLSEEESRTPASRAYFALQCAYIFPDRQEEYLQAFDGYLNDYVAACPSALPISEEIRERLAGDQIYKAMKSAQKLIFHENGVLKSLEGDLENLQREGEGVADASSDPS